MRLPGAARAHWWLNRERLEAHTVNGELLIPPATETCLRELRDREDALLARAAPFEDAAHALGVTVVAVECLIRQGVLDVDPERGPNNARYVTRASITRARAAS